MHLVALGMIGIVSIFLRITALMNSPFLHEMTAKLSVLGLEALGSVV